MGELRGKRSKWQLGKLHHVAIFVGTFTLTRENFDSLIFIFYLFLFFIYLFFFA